MESVHIMQKHFEICDNIFVWVENCDLILKL